MFIYIAPECGKHAIHYGGICCYSCRAFFRRAHQNTKIPYFICRTETNEQTTTIAIGSGQTTSQSERQIVEDTNVQCGTDVRTKRQCQYHRLKRCIEIGKTLRVKYN